MNLQLDPVLNDGQYVFVSIVNASLVPRKIPICEFKEKEGSTLVINKAYADKNGFNYDTVFAWITLDIHSSLNDIGLTAAFSNELAQQNISCNVIAGFFHDHIFVPFDKAAKAVEALKKL